jgi:hypothetical protein
MLIECSRDNPFRQPDWRWQRALGIVEGTQPNQTRRYDGPVGFKWIKKAVDFRTAMRAATTDVQRREVANRFPDVFWAHYAWDNNNNPVKHQLEAYILAREENWSIGFKCGMAPEQIEAYECIFFNVREKLNHLAYILHSVIGPALQRSLSEREYSSIWKLYAYYYGPHVLEALASKMVNPMWCGTPDTVNTALQDDAIGTMKMKAAMAAKTVSVAAHTQIELLHIFTKFVEVERTTDSAGKAQDQMLEHITAMMLNLPFAIDSRDPREKGATINPGPAGDFDGTAVELSYEETMVVAAGHVLPNAGLLSQMTYPPLPQTSIEEEVGGPQ